MEIGFSPVASTMPGSCATIVRARFATAQVNAYLHSAFLISLSMGGIYHHNLLPPFILDKISMLFFVLKFSARIIARISSAALSTKSLTTT